MCINLSEYQAGDAIVCVYLFIYLHFFSPSRFDYGLDHSTITPWSGMEVRRDGVREKRKGGNEGGMEEG